MKAIFVDAGHGMKNGIDNGASGGGTDERTQVLEIAQDVIGIMHKMAIFGLIGIYDIGIIKRLSLQQKIDEINAIIVRDGIAKDDALVISIHANAGGGTGVETWYDNGKASTLATAIVNALAASTGLANRGAKPDDQNRHGSLGIVQNTNADHTCLAECGFIDSDDVKLLKDPEKDDLFAVGIVKGICEFLSLQYDPKTFDSPFEDVSYDRWSAPAIRWCKEQGILRGYGEGKLFMPNRPMTREEVAITLYRALKK